MKKTAAQMAIREGSKRKNTWHVGVGTSVFLGMMGMTQATPLNEGLVKKSWGLNSGYGVEAPKAWMQMLGNCAKATTVVAVIDTGIDPNHTALKDTLWANDKELKGKDGVDDDGNGFVDDINGWDFAKNSGKLSDSHGHGTHIAGIIAGFGKDKDSFKGVCPGTKIMTLRYYDPNGSGEDNLKNTIKAINYAVESKVDIINYSGGGAEFAQGEFEALKKAEKAGILVVAAAGNERSDADKNLYFPAAYNLSNIISVTAIDEKGQVLPSSNWGIKKVHVAAPGQSILSTLPNGGYGFMTGTSQATAFVSGIAAMLRAESPKMDFLKIKEIISNSSQKFPQLQGKTMMGAKVNALLALQMAHGRKLSSEQSTDSLKTAGPPNALLNRDAGPSMISKVFGAKDERAEGSKNRKANNLESNRATDSVGLKKIKVSQKKLKKRNR